MNNNNNNNNSDDKITTDKILYLSFNLDGTCFNIGHTDGFIIYNTDPFKLKFKLSGIGEIKIVEILNKTNLVAIIGTNNNRLYPSTKVTIWDDITQGPIGLQSFKEEIVKTKIKTDKLFIVTNTRIHILDMSTFEEIEQYVFYEGNTLGNNGNINMISLSSDPTNTVLAWPSTKDNEMGKTNIKLYESNRYYTINCHKNNLQCIALNNKGTILATASNKGTLIRLFETSTGKLIQELRRGSTVATIQFITFSPNSKYLCVSSDRDSIHIFEIKDPNNPKVTTVNQSSSLSFMSSILPSTYFKSEWSFIQICLSNNFRINNGKFIIAFSQNENSLIIITITGKYFKYEFKPGTKYIKRIKNLKWF